MKPAYVPLSRRIMNNLISTNIALPNSIEHSTNPLPEGNDGVVSRREPHIGKVYLQTFGCQMNDRDSERILGMLAEDGYVAIDSPEDADLILLNTCAIRANPENKVYPQRPYPLECGHHSEFHREA